MSGCDAKAKSEVEIMWTNQHGTGPKTDDRVETQVILQYMCQAYPEGKMTTNDVNREFQYHTIRNGQTLTTQGFANGARENAYIRKDRGLHEPANYYQAYFRRERNKGVYTLVYSEIANETIAPCKETQVNTFLIPNSMSVELGFRIPIVSRVPNSRIPRLKGRETKSVMGDTNASFITCLETV